MSSENALEEGTAPQIDFAKLRAIGEAQLPVVPVALQDADSHELLFIGYANDLTLRESLASRTAVLWSTSRNELWRKGATSGDVLDLVEVRVNCEQNSLLYLVRPRSGACHTRDSSGASRRSCYYRSMTEKGDALEHR